MGDLFAESDFFQATHTFQMQRAQGPPNPPKGHVWRKFEGRKRDGHPARRYEIRDLDLKDKEICLQMTKNSFLRDEPLCQVLDILSDEPSVSTILSNWSGYIDDQLTLACYSDDVEPAGFALCQVLGRDDEDEEDLELIKGDQWKKLLQTLIAIDQTCDVYSHYGVEKYFSIHVMSVEAGHRGQNIGVELFRAAEQQAKHLKIPVISVACTATASQVLADKCGYTLLSVFPYKNMLDRGIDLYGCKSDVAKVYGKRID